MTDDTNNDRLEQSIAGIDAALEALHGLIDDERRIIGDPMFLFFLKEDVLHEDTQPYLVFGPPEDLTELKDYFRNRFSRELPRDLEYMLGKVNGMTIAPEPDPNYWADDNRWLPASEIIDVAERLRDQVTWDGQEHPALPVAHRYPGGDVLALWIDDSAPPYRIVAYDHETSSNRSIPVVAESLGDVFQKFVKSKLHVGDTARRKIDRIDITQRES